MITINYKGQFGNCMFQYVFARLHADINNINLGTSGPVEIPTTPTLTFDEPPKKGTIVVDDNFYYNHRLQNGSIPLKLDPEYDYIVDGYFQDAELCNQYVEQIRGYFNIEYPEPIQDKVIVLVRLGDKAHSGDNSEIIHYTWYQQILSTIGGSKDFSITSNKINESICTSKEKQEEYIKHIVTAADRVLTADQDLLKEFLEVMTYNTIVCSNSTWGWWACFLSRAKNIYTFDKFGMFGVPVLRTHGVHVNALSNIRNISRVVEGNFIDISQL